MRKCMSKYIILMLFICFIFMGILFGINDYSISFFMPIAPLIYMMCLCIVYMKRFNAFSSIVVLTIFATSFLRMVLIPTIYVMSGYVSIINTSAGTQYLNEAVFLVCFEMICTTLFILSSKKLKVINWNKSIDNLDSNVKIKNQVKIILFCLLFLGVVCVWMDKSVLVIISTIFDRFSATAEMNIARRQAYLSARKNSSILFNLFQQIVFYLQILLPAYFISYTTNKRDTIDSNRGFILSLIITALSVVFITDNNADSVCIMLACMMVLYIAYNKRMLKFFPIIIVSVVVFILLFLFSKVGINIEEGIKLDELSTVLCAYFATFPNVSCGFAVQYHDKLATFWGDIVSGVPYMIALFRGFPQSVMLYNDVVHGYTGLTNQIMPLIAYGYQYLGVFAPTFTLIVYNLALKLEVKFRNTNKTFNRVLYALMFINLSIGPCIWGFPSIIKRLCYYLPLLILAKMNCNQDMRYYK